jgi:hypothetical protein
VNASWLAGPRKTLAVVAMVCAGCAPAPAPATAPVAASAPIANPASSPPATSSPSATPSDVLASHRAAFDACYAQARAKDPALGRTRVEMTFTIDADGTPHTVDLKYRNRFDDRAKDCMRDAALSLRFPASMQGTQTATIEFTPSGP